MTVRTIDEELVLREQKTGSELVGALLPVLLAGVLCTTPIAELTSSIGEALVEDAIVNGVTTKAPSQNAVYDALALKADASALSSYLSIASAAGTYLSIASAIAGYQPLDADLTSWSAVIRAAGFDAFVASPSSSNLRSLVSDETGSGALVFATSPVLVTPNLGTPSAGVLTNCTGLPNTSVIGLGTAALATIGTSGDTVPKNNTANTFSAAQTFGVNPTINAAGAPSGLFVAVAGALRTFLGEANAGQIDLLCYSDAGSFLGSALSVVRATQAVNFTQRPTVAAVNIVTVSSADTLSNKTLSSPTLSGTVAGSPTASGSWTFPNLTIDANGFSRVVHKDGGTAIWSTGLRADNDPNYYIYQESGSGIVSIASDIVASSVGPTSVYSLGYRGTPQNIQNSTYTFVLADAGKQVHAFSGSPSWTIPPNSSVPFPLGTVIVLLSTGATISLLEGSGVSLNRGDGTSGSGTRTIGNNSIAAITKSDTNTWIISGAFT